MQWYWRVSYQEKQWTGIETEVVSCLKDIRHRWSLCLMTSAAKQGKLFTLITDLIREKWQGNVLWLTHVIQFNRSVLLYSVCYLMSFPCMSLGLRYFDSIHLSTSLPIRFSMYQVCSFFLLLGWLLTLLSQMNTTCMYSTVCSFVSSSTVLSYLIIFSWK